MTTLRDQLIAAGAIRPSGSARTGKPPLRIDDAGIRSACLDILRWEGTDIARDVVANPDADPRVVARLERMLVWWTERNARYERDPSFIWRSNMRAVA